jgi:hypothetical protein
MTGCTFLTMKASTSFKYNIRKDKPYYKIADITPVGIPPNYHEKCSPFIYEVIEVEHHTAEMIESYIVKVESEDSPHSTVIIADWASHHSIVQEKVVEVVNAAVVNARTGKSNVRPTWLYDQHQGFQGAVVQSANGCIWVDVVAVPVQPIVDYTAVPEQVAERPMGMEG